MTELLEHKDIPGPCPLCGGVSRELFVALRNDHRFGIDQCACCRLAWTRPSSRRAWEETGGFSGYYGAGKSKFLSPLQLIRDAAMRFRARRYLSLLVPGHETWALDVGCAEGRLLNALLRYGCRCFGVEHPDYPEERFINADQIVYHKGDAAFEDLPSNRFDLIFLWHVLEHVHEPWKLLRRLRALLSEDGLLVIAVPNFASKEAFAFKQNWFHLDVPHHRYHFSKPSLQHLATEAGLRITRSSDFCPEQGPYGLIQSTLNAMGWCFNECYEALKGNLNPRRIPLLACQTVIGLFLAMPALLLTALQAGEGKGAVVKMTLKKDKRTSPETKNQ